jgi:Arc/MetJ family transcription regulator
MRTTVNIDDALLAEVRQRAASERRNIGAVINDALRENLARRQARPTPSGRESLVTFRGNGVRPGVNLDCTSELLDIMDGTA